jgi:tetratricopeptide (TPR) repeat protein
MALSQGALNAMEEAHELFSQADLRSAKDLLASTLYEGSQHEDVFDVCCMRAALAVMEGEAPAESLRNIPESSRKSATRNYFDGVSYLARGSLRSARLKFEELLRTDMTFGLAHLGLAAISFSQKLYQESFGCFRRTMEFLGPAAPPLSRVGLAMCAYHLKDGALARRCVDRALEVNANDALAKLVQVVLLVEERQIRKLVETVGDLRRIAPGNTVVVQRVADLAYFKAVSQNAVKERAPSLRTLALSVLPNANDHQAAYAHFQAGRISSAAGDLQDAKTLLTQAVKAVPDLVAASIHLAKVQIQLGERADALSTLKSLDAKYASERETLEMLLVLESEEGHHEIAMDYARRLASLAPSEASTWRLSAWAHRLDAAGALKLLQHCRASVTKSGAPVPWQLRADIAAVDPDTSISDLEALVKERVDASDADHPSVAALMFNVALKYERTDVDRAIRWYTDIVRQFPALAEPYFRLYHLCTEKKWHGQAMKWMALLQQARPTETLHTVYTANTLDKLGRQSTAVSLLTNAASKTKSIHLAIALGSMYLWSAQQSSRKALRYLNFAKNRFEYALGKDPANLLGAHGLASCTGALSLANEAQLALERIRELQPNDAYVVENMQSHIANVLVTCDSFRAARASLEPLRNKSPGQYSALAFCYVGTNEFHKAIKVLEAGLEAHPNYPSLVYNAALVYCAGVMHELLPQNCTFLTEDAAEVLRGWMSNGLRLAHSFNQTKPPSWFEAGAAAQQFVCHVARYTYHLKERMYSLQKAGTGEKIRSARDADGWKRKFQERNEELENAKRLAAERLHDAELQLAETYAALQERQQHITQPNPYAAAQGTDMVFPTDEFDDGAKRGRDDGGIATNLDELGMTEALALGGMFVDDPEL